MITGKQLRAARGLLDWGVEQLAEKAKINRDTIFNIEKGLSQPRESTVKSIVRVIEENGVEFTDSEGVRIKPTTVDTYIGPDRFDEFYNFLYEHMLDRGGEVCLSVFDEGLLAKHRKNPEIQRQRMRQLVKTGFVSYRVLVTIGDFTGDYVEYREQPAQAASPTAFYAFGICLALISFPQDMSPHVVVIKSEPLSQAYRQAFHASWEKARPINKSEIEKRKIELRKGNKD